MKPFVLTNPGRIGDCFLTTRSIQFIEIAYEHERVQHIHRTSPENSKDMDAIIFFSPLWDVEESWLLLYEALEQAATEAERLDPFQRWGAE